MSLTRRDFLESSLIALAGLGLLPGLGQTDTEARAHLKKWAVKAARLIDGTGNAPIESPTLVIQGDRIAAVGPASRFQLDSSVEIIDLGKETLLPGLIDTHNHPTLKPIGAGTNASSYLSQFYDSLPRLTARAIRNLRIDLLGGVTTARVVGELNFLDVSLAAEIEAGTIPGPRLLPSGPRLAPTGGHVWIPEWSVDGPDNLRTAIRDYVSRGARLIKIGLLDETAETTSYSADELHAIVGEAHGLGVPVTAHCTGRWGSSIRLSLAADVDVIEHVTPLNEQIIEEFLKSGAGMSLTPFVYGMAWPQPVEYWQFQDSVARSAKEWMDYNAQKSQAHLEKHPELMTEDQLFGKEVFPALEPWMESVKQAWQAGVPLAVGSDAPHGVLPLNVEFLVRCGISPLGAITAATGVAAKISRLEKVTGTLSPGMQADFISVRGNPLEDIRALRDIDLVVRSGVPFRAMSFV